MVSPARFLTATENRRRMVAEHRARGSRAPRGRIGDAIARAFRSCETARADENTIVPIPPLARPRARPRDRALRALPSRLGGDGAPPLGRRASTSRTTSRPRWRARPTTARRPPTRSRSSSRARARRTSRSASARSVLKRSAVRSFVVSTGDLAMRLSGVLRRADGESDRERRTAPRDFERRRRPPMTRLICAWTDLR